MKNQSINFKNNNHNYSIIIGKNSLKNLPKKIKSVCPAAKNIAFIIDQKIPLKFKSDLRKMLKNYRLLFLPFASSEKKNLLNL